ncbi:MAG: ImmA/IrrE family metallo-endopeptidase [Lachnospiraceae bacterium]|nr:ImmA/IrrE family metallo-endopeptidase [Lachnospiraceae bacterium]
MIAEFLKRNQIKAGDPIDVIAKALNVKPGGADGDISGQARLSKPDQSGSMTVTFRKGLMPQERLFAFAHECAHLINQDQAPAARSEGRNKPMAEQRADYTAAALLMPADHVYEYLNENHYRDTTARKRVALIGKLCKRYGVSDVIALRRVKEVYALNRQ